MAFSATFWRQSCTWEWFVSQASLMIGLCCPKPAWGISVPTSHGLQEEQQSSRSTAGRIAPFSVLALPLLSNCSHSFLPDLNHLNWNFPCLASLLFRKTKWFSSFGVWLRKKHVLFCSHWKTLLTHPSLSPLPRCVVLWCLVLFSFLALCADLHVHNLAVGTGFQTDSNTGAPKPGVGTKPMDLEAELTGGNTDRHKWAYPALH